MRVIEALYEVVAGIGLIIFAIIAIIAVLVLHQEFGRE